MEIWRETDRLRMLIKLKLNPVAELDMRVQHFVDALYVSNTGIGREGGLALLDQLIVAGQNLINSEWEKIKQEAKFGDLRDSWRMKAARFIESQKGY